MPWNRARELNSPWQKWRRSRTGELRAVGLGVCVLLTLLPGSARAQEQVQEVKQGPVAEDELAPVRALQAQIRQRLAEPVESLDIDLIMEGTGFSGTRPGAVRWDGRGERLWFRWKRWDQERTGTWELSTIC